MCKDPSLSLAHSKQNVFPLSGSEQPSGTSHPASLKGSWLSQKSHTKISPPDNWLAGSGRVPSHRLPGIGSLLPAPAVVSQRCRHPRFLSLFRKATAPCPGFSKTGLLLPLSFLSLSVSESKIFVIFFTSLLVYSVPTFKNVKYVCKV